MNLCSLMAESSVCNVLFCWQQRHEITNGVTRLDLTSWFGGKQVLVVT